MTEDHTGDPDGARGPAGNAAGEPDGSTRVIHTDRTVPVTGWGAHPATAKPAAAPPTVHVPTQAPPPRVEHGPGRTHPPAAAGYGSAPVNPYGPPAAHANPYGPPAHGGPAGHGVPPGYGAPTAYGAAPTYGAPPAHGASAPAPGYGPPGYPGAGHPYAGASAGRPGAAPPPGYAPAPAGGRRRTVTVLVALVAILALLAGGTVAYLYLRGGGGDTPAEATRLLADDLESADWGRAVTRLHPDEVTLGGDLGTMLHDELVRLEVVRADADPDGALTGTTFANLQFDDAAVEQVRPNVAVAKLVGGTITLNRDANTELLTDSFKRLAYPGGVPPTRAPEVVDIAKVVAEQGRPVRVATVQVDGDWYVSLTYSLADNALVQAGETWPQDAVPARGAATPQDALRDAVSSLFAQDARRLVELAPPHELAVIHDVGPLLVERAGTPRPTGRLVDLATTPTDVPGGTALTIDRIVAADTRGNQVTVVRDGDCLSVTQSRSFGGPTRLCAEQLAAQGVTSMPGGTDPGVRDIIVRATRAALGLRVVVVEDDGQYYVSPARSLVGLGIDVLHILQPADLARLADIGR